MDLWSSDQQVVLSWRTFKQLRTYQMSLKIIDVKYSSFYS